MCRLLGVSRSTFYAWRRQVETATAARRRELTDQVRRVFNAARGTYGCRRGTAPPHPDRTPPPGGPGAPLLRGHRVKAGPPRAGKPTPPPRPPPTDKPAPPPPGVYRH